MQPIKKCPHFQPKRARPTLGAGELPLGKARKNWTRWIQMQRVGWPLTAHAGACAKPPAFRLGLLWWYCSFLLYSIRGWGWQGYPPGLVLGAWAAAAVLKLTASPCTVVPPPRFTILGSAQGEMSRTDSPISRQPTTTQRNNPAARMMVVHRLDIKKYRAR